MPSAQPFPEPRQILVVDDDAELRSEVCAYLSEHGYVATGAADAREMDQALDAGAIDLVVLDLMLPGEDGLSICRRLSQSGGPAIIMLSAMSEDVDKILGLELGADDYVAKSASPRELVARVRAVLRRQEEVRRGAGLKGEAYQFLGFSLDTLRRRLTAPGGTAILLTAGEYSLLRAFLEHPRRVLPRDQLLDLARGEEADVYDRAIDVQISRLRRKLHAFSAAEIIRTYRGAGYLFDAVVTRG